MYEFAILVLAGLATAKTVDLLRSFAKDLPKSGVLLATMAVGVAYAYLLGFSVFAGWGVDVRSGTIGTVGTGLFMAGLAGAWHQSLAMLREHAHRSHGEASAIEARVRAA
jgi:hypothetical protein